MKKDKKIIELLNKLYNWELESHRLYCSFASNLKSDGLIKISEFIKKLALDKIGPHNDLVFNYLGYFNESIFVIDEIIKKQNYKIENKKNKREVVIEILERILNNENKIRELVSEIADKSLILKDFETFEFIQWFIKDYIKDINEVNLILLKVKENNISLFDIKD